MAKVLDGKLPHIKQIVEDIAEFSWQYDYFTTALSIYDIIINGQRCLLKEHYWKATAYT